ncbi:MAG: hypothetical protein GX434_01380 [Peptococcaceae bacterium]|nr:hypothetical protein [Peptococcaceae bacterium]
MRNNQTFGNNYPGYASQWNTYSNYSASAGNPLFMSSQIHHRQLSLPRNPGYLQDRNPGYLQDYSPLYPNVTPGLVPAPVLPISSPVYNGFQLPYPVIQTANQYPHPYEYSLNNPNNLERILIAILILVSLDLIFVRPVKQARQENLMLPVSE